MLPGGVGLTDDGCRTGQPCACFACGKLVYPLPLNVPMDPRISIERGHGSVAVVTDEETREIYLVPCLFCPACAGPAEVDIYRTRFEPMVAGPHHDVTAHANELARAARIALTFYAHLLASCTRTSSTL